MYINIIYLIKILHILICKCRICSPALRHELGRFEFKFSQVSQICCMTNYTLTTQLTVDFFSKGLSSRPVLRIREISTMCLVGVLLIHLHPVLSLAAKHCWYVCTDMFMCERIYIYTYIYICSHVCIYVYVLLSIYMHIYTYIYMYTFLSIYMHIYTYF